MTDGLPDSRGRFGLYGGRFVPETLMEPLRELEEIYLGCRDEEEFNRELRRCH